MWELIAILASIKEIEDIFVTGMVPERFMEVNKLYAEGKKLYAEGRKAQCEKPYGHRLYAEGNKLYAEGNKLLILELEKLERSLETYGLPSY